MQAQAETSLVRAKQLLTNFGPARKTDGLLRANKAMQQDGWSCGFWCLEWVEIRLRQLRGEPRCTDPSTNEISKSLALVMYKVKGNAMPEKPKVAQEKLKAPAKQKLKNPRVKPRMLR